MQPDLHHMGVVQAHRLPVWPLLRGLCIDEQAFTVNGIRNGANPVAGVCSCLGVSHVLVACTDSLGAVMPHWRQELIAAAEGAPASVDCRQ